MAGVRWATVTPSRRIQAASRPGSPIRSGSGTQIAAPDLERREEVALQRVVRQAGEQAEAVGSPRPKRPAAARG